MNNALTKEHFKTAQEIKDILENKYPSIHPNSEWINVFKVASAVKMLKEKLNKVTIYADTNNKGLYKPDVEKLIDECFPAFKEEIGLGQREYDPDEEPKEW